MMAWNKDNRPRHKILYECPTGKLSKKYKLPDVSDVEYETLWVGLRDWVKAQSHQRNAFSFLTKVAMALDEEQDLIELDLTGGK